MTGTINNLVKKLTLTQTGGNLFNQYNEFSKLLDNKTAPGIRQQNLRLYLNSQMTLKTKVLWLYLVPNHLEAVQSGIPLVDTTTFKQAETVLGIIESFETATKSKNKPNNTVLLSVLWDVAEEMHVNPIIWPVIPFYTHKEGNTKISRKPTNQEITKYKWVLMNIIDIYKPTLILAIGEDTDRALKVLGIKAKYIQHPRKGKELFKNAVARYG